MPLLRTATATLGSAAACAALVAAGPAAHADDSPTYTNLATGTTSTYEVVPGKLSWEQARDAAAATTGGPGCTGHLAVITSQAEQDFVHDRVPGAKDVFLGATKSATSTANDDGWQWVTGEAWGFTAWDDGEPNNYDGVEDRLMINYRPDDTTGWNDIAEGWRTGYLLEMECPARLVRATVSSVSPATGPVAGGGTVTITGQHFTGTRAVRFGGAAASFTVDSDTQITATVPAYSGSAGDRRSKRFVAVRVTTTKPNAQHPAVRYLYQG